MGFGSKIYKGNFNVYIHIKSIMPISTVIKAVIKQKTIFAAIYMLLELLRMQLFVTLLFHSTAKLAANGKAAKTAITFLNASKSRRIFISIRTSSPPKAPPSILIEHIRKTPIMLK